MKQACANYVQHLRDAGKKTSAHDAEKRFARWVNNHKVGLINLQKLKPGDVDVWRKWLAATPAIPQNKASKAPVRARSASTSIVT